jgi:transposase
MQENVSIKCSNCERLERRIIELERIVAEQAKLISEQAQLIKELQDELRKGKRQAHPFGKGMKTPGLKKKPGRQKGQGHFRHQEMFPVADETIKSHLESCPECSSDLVNKQPQVNYQSDLAEVRIKVTHYQGESGYCLRCQKKYTSRGSGQIVTAQGAARHGLGPGLKSLASFLKHDGGLSYRKIDSLFQEVFGLSYSASAQIQTEQRLEGALATLFTRLKKEVRQSAVIHVDETGWRIGSQSAWLWTFTNANTTLYQISPSRAHDIVENLLGSDYSGLLHSDFYSAYGHHDLKEITKQKCLAHLLKDLKQLESKSTGKAKSWAGSLKSFLQQAVRWNHCELPPDFAQLKYQDLLQRLQTWIHSDIQFEQDDFRRMVKRLRNHQEQLFQFLLHPEAQPTNNPAERAIRPAVITRKTSRCNQIQQGADLHAYLASLIVTARQRGQNPLRFLKHFFLQNNTALTFTSR